MKSFMMFRETLLWAHIRLFRIRVLNDHNINSICLYNIVKLLNLCNIFKELNVQ